MINMNSFFQNNFKALKHRKIMGLTSYIAELCRSVQYPSQSRKEVVDHLGRSINTILNNVFDDFHADI